jgi:hypothetical protein
MVVPHCLPLLWKFQCHLNFEVANTSHLFQYLFKYIHKGDCVSHHVHALLTKLQDLIMHNIIFVQMIPRKMLMRLMTIGMHIIYRRERLLGLFLAIQLQKRNHQSLPLVFT